MEICCKTAGCILVNAITASGQTEDPSCACGGGRVNIGGGVRAQSSDHVTGSLASGLASQRRVVMKTLKWLR